VLVLSRLPESHGRGFADSFYAAREGRAPELSEERPATLALAAAIVQRVVELVRRPDVCTERVLDLLQGAAQGDDVTRTPDTTVAEVRKAVARIRFDVDFEDPADPRGAAAHALAEVLDPSSDVVALQEILARCAWAAVNAWEPRRVLAFLLDVERLFDGASV
jgi:hypothetical protein